MISDIDLPVELQKAVEDLGFIEWTEIQKKTIPLIREGKDVLGQSLTGSGKTVAFGLPIIERVVHNRGLQALILVPTRELCEQVYLEMNKFARHKRMNIIAVYGGVSINNQIGRLPHADIVVGTPGRILDHLQRGTIGLHNVKILVLDEADRMLDMGFIDDIRKIISHTPKDRQTLLFSATISEDVHQIARNYMKESHRVQVKSYVDEGKMEQVFYDVDTRDKFSLLVHILKNEKPHLAIIFCGTRRMVDILSNNLYKQGIGSQPLHGGLTQGRRKQSIDMFHSKKVNILVASDVAARGLDIKNVSHVINYDIPKTSKEYIHRIGRTARAGETGKVISLLASQDHENFREVLKDRSINIEQLNPPQFNRLSFFMPQRRRFGGGYRGGGGFEGRRGAFRGDRREGFRRGFERRDRRASGRRF